MLFIPVQTTVAVSSLAATVALIQSGQLAQAGLGEIRGVHPSDVLNMLFYGGVRDVEAIAPHNIPVQTLGQQRFFKGMSDFSERKPLQEGGTVSLPISGSKKEGAFVSEIQLASSRGNEGTGGRPRKTVRNPLAGVIRELMEDYRFPNYKELGQQAGIRAETIYRLIYKGRASDPVIAALARAFPEFALQIQWANLKGRERERLESLEFGNILRTLMKKYQIVSYAELDRRVGFSRGITGDGVRDGRVSDDVMEKYRAVFTDEADWNRLNAARRETKSHRSKKLPEPSNPFERVLQELMKKYGVPSYAKVDEQVSLLRSATHHGVRDGRVSDGVMEKYRGIFTDPDDWDRLNETRRGEIPPGPGPKKRGP